jgi:L-threonylcarbamoyladenylate synthase
MFLDLDEAVAALRAGGVVAIPTDTVYGLAVDPRIPGATPSLFAIKGRPESVALPLLVPDLASAVRLAGRFDNLAIAFAVKCWPVPLAIVVDVLPAGHAASFDLGGDGRTAGMRCPDNSLVLELLRASGPLAVTSANRHGEPPLTAAEAVRATFGNGVGAVVDGGICDGKPSTVVACRDGAWEILRPGAISAVTLTDIAGQRASRVEAGPIGNLK